jgi:plasmid stabilization system protein ParE
MRNAQSILALSIAVNIVLMTTAITLWSTRPDEARNGGAPSTPGYFRSEPSRMDSEQEEAEFGNVRAVSLPFHWSQVESEDYREYMANLRAMGCPEMLVHDMILAELQDEFRKRRSRIQREPVPPWAGADRRQALQQEYLRQLHALVEEQRSVMTELLGFAWSDEDNFLRDASTAILLGHLTDDQAIETAGLFRIYSQRAGWIRIGARNILLDEDWEALAALDKELKAELELILTPGQWEETLMRTQYWEQLADEAHLHLAGLTGSELRRLTQLYIQRVDAIAEGLIQSRVVSETEHAERQREIEADWLKVFGPAKAAALKRATDDRFQELVEFAQQRHLPPEMAVSAYEIRLATEQELQRLRADSLLDSSAIARQIEEVQATTLEALTRLLGSAHIGEYVARTGAWLDFAEPRTDEGEEVVP